MIYCLLFDIITIEIEINDARSSALGWYMKIIVDAMGGDNAPEQIVIGAIEAIKADKDLSVVLVGKKNDIDAVLSESDGKYDKERI